MKTLIVLVATLFIGSQAFAGTNHMNCEKMPDCQNCMKTDKSADKNDAYKSIQRAHPLPGDKRAN